MAKKGPPSIEVIGKINSLLTGRSLSIWPPRQEPSQQASSSEPPDPSCSLVELTFLTSPSLGHLSLFIYSIYVC